MLLASVSKYCGVSLTVGNWVRFLMEMWVMCLLALTSNMCSLHVLCHTMDKQLLNLTVPRSLIR